MNTLESFLNSQSRNEKIIFIPNQGNAGDAIINCSEYLLFRKYNIDFETPTAGSNLVDIVKNRIVYYGGGGGLVPHYSAAQSVIGTILAHTKKFILLPTTIRDCDAVIALFRENDVIMCRDSNSYTYVSRTAASGVVVYDFEDAALTLDAQKFLQTPPNTYRYLLQTFSQSKYHLKIALQEYIRWRILFFKYKIKRIASSRPFIINIIRKDLESTIPQPLNNLDISSYLEGNDMSELGSSVVAYRMMIFLNLFDVIYTNRLHAAIGGLLLAKEVHLLDNSYGKNYAIYKKSLRHRFNKIFLENAAK